MTTEAGKHAADVARELHEDSRYDEAIQQYTSAAYEYIGADGLQHGITACSGVHYLSMAAAVLRLQDRLEECQNYCWQGVYISETIGPRALEHLPEDFDPLYAYDMSEYGVWFEFSGDFRAVGNLPEMDAAYDRAKEIYADVGDPGTGSFEQFHNLSAKLTSMLVRETDLYTDEWEDVFSHGATMTDWIEFKRRRLPKLVHQLDEQDDWTYVF